MYRIILSIRVHESHLYGQKNYNLSYYSNGFFVSIWIIDGMNEMKWMNDMKLMKWNEWNEMKWNNTELTWEQQITRFSNNLRVKMIMNNLLVRKAYN